MDNKTLSVFLGEQCRKYRKMCGMTQEDLAEKMNTSVQTISNYERNGIKDVEVEEEIASILGKNLREKTADKEGTVGEVGKEILFHLLKNYGMSTVKWLEKDLYGMSDERIDHEIEKIAELDLCSRDKYKDANGDECDEIFITAKGIITYKNLVNDDFHADQIHELLPSVKSYETRLKPHWYYEEDLPDAKDMEDYVSMRPWISILRRININTTYRTDYIFHMMRMSGELGNLALNHVITPYMVGLPNLGRGIVRIFPCMSAYHDIIYRMAYGLTDKWREKNLFSAFSNDKVNRHTELWMEIEGYPSWEEDSAYDEVVSNTAQSLATGFPWINSSSLREGEGPFPHTPREDDRIEMINEYEEIERIQQPARKFIEDEEERKRISLEHMPKGKENLLPDEWFTKEEIEAFILENYNPPRNDTERQIQKDIDQLEKMRPEFKGYYKFPKKWEENGLADLVRKQCGLKK